MGGGETGFEMDLMQEGIMDRRGNRDSQHQTADGLYKDSADITDKGRKCWWKK